MFALFRQFRLFRPFNSGTQGGRLAPIFLTKSDGTVFVTADGKAIVRGFRVMT